MNTTNTSHPARTLIVLAFAAIYLVWGSTYLAIRVVVETLPPPRPKWATFIGLGW